MRKSFTLVIGCTLLLALALGATMPVRAQDQRCFPQTNQCISGRFRQYWEQNGGLAIFGFPITAARNEVNPDNDHTYLTQWFERARFEWHPENQPPYDVLLGRLGAEANPPATPTTTTPQPGPAYTNRDSPVDLLASYYNAINRQEYQRAYGYWESPPSTYDVFVQGYQNTASVQLIVQPPTFIGGAAGSSYSSVPTVLIARQRDGSQRMFAGCYITRKSNMVPPDVPQPDVWHLYSATVAPVGSGASIPALLMQACPS